MKRIFDLSIIKSKFFIVMMIAIVAFHLMISFTVIRSNDTRIPVFSFERIVERNIYYARVLGSHVLKTEHGQIRLGHFSRITTGSGGGINIDRENFENGRVSHNLVIEGMTIPQNVSIFIDANAQILILDNYDQEIILSGISLGIRVLDFIRHVNEADMLVRFIPPDHITLADHTQIYFPLGVIGNWFLRSLFIYKKDGLWVIRDLTAVKRPSETEFTRYRSITFRPDWGEFIEGDLFE